MQKNKLIASLSSGLSEMNDLLLELSDGREVSHKDVRRCERTLHELEVRLRKLKTKDADFEDFSGVAVCNMLNRI